MSENGGKIAIIVAIIEFIGLIIAAIIGVVFAKENSTKMIQENENIIVLSEEIQEMENKNEKIKNEISTYKEEIEELKSQNKELETKLAIANSESEDIQAMEYRNFGLFIDGEEKLIEKDKSLVLINGRKYYSKDFVDNLLPPDKAATEKNNMLYIGKIVKGKSNLLDRQIIDITDRSQVKLETNVKDTYGNIYDKAVLFLLYDNSITFNANREYSKLKCVLNVMDGRTGGGIIQIESEEGILYTSEEILSTTEPLEIDIPINYASSITIKKIGMEETCNMITDAVLYNEE